MGVRILICDDHPLFREGLRRMLETVADFCVVAESERADDAIRMSAELRPDVVLGIERFGASAPYQRIYQELGLTVENVVAKAKELLNC